MNPPLSTRRHYSYKFWTPDIPVTPVFKPFLMPLTPTLARFLEPPAPVTPLVGVARRTNVGYGDALNIRL